MANNEIPTQQAGPPAPKLNMTPLAKVIETPAVTSGNLPQPGSGVVTGTPAGRSAVVRTPAPLVARPLGGPEFTNVRWKNPEVTGRWVLRSDPGKNGSTLRFDQAQAQGFRVATPADADVPGLSPIENKYIVGDLILMCISKAIYDGAVLFNKEQAEFRANPRTVMQAARNELRYRNRPELGHEVATFVPGKGEADEPGGGASLYGRPDLPE
jgi:hypothetical protein